MTPTNRRLAGAVIAVIAAVGLVACGDDSGDSAEDTTTTEAEVTTTTEAEDETTTTTEVEEESAAPSIAEVATANGASFIPSYTQFAPGYAEALGGEGPVTALMPNDDAFVAFSQAYPNLTNQLRSDFAALDAVLLYHVIDGELLAEAIAGETELMTLQGEPITVEVVGADVVLNGGQGKVAIADLEASNGVVHILDGILLPPTVAATAS